MHPWTSIELHVITVPCALIAMSPRIRSAAGVGSLLLTPLLPLQSTLMPKGYECVSIPVDGEGIIPGEMRSVLEQRKAAGLKQPKMLYTIPVAQNPTGAITSEARKVRLPLTVAIPQ